ncbi:DUF397 domain-containing protein [Streptomyces thermocarboxydus]
MSHTDTPDGRWRKSSYSGPGDGNECVEVAASPPAYPSAPRRRLARPYSMSPARPSTSSSTR